MRLNKLDFNIKEGEFACMENLKSLKQFYKALYLYQVVLSFISS